MKDKSQQTSLTQVIGSVIAAVMGVQSDEKRQRDFNATNPKTYIIAGIIFTILFIISIVTVVNLVVD